MAGATGAHSFQQVLPYLDLVLHARLPPVVRPIPSVSAISLFQAEESQEETDARQMLGSSVRGTELNQISTGQHDVDMAEPLRAARIEPAHAPPPPHPSFGVAQRSPAPIATEPLRAGLVDPMVAAPVVPPASQQIEPVGDEEAHVAPAPSKSAGPTIPRPAAPPQKVKEPAVHPMVPIIPDDEDTEDQEMPAIDLASDSEEEED
jgi:hypothetical protein